MKQPITLILLGDIAAGKGTQAKIIVKKFDLKLIDTGAYTRKVLTGKSKVSRRLARAKLGKLAPSDIIQGYLKTQIAKFKIREGVLIDGGKMPAEARLINQLLVAKKRKILVIYLRIPQTETFRRLHWRFYCERTGEPLVIKNHAKSCSNCGGKIIKRADDDPKAITNRIAYYKKVYSQTVKFWKKKGVLRMLNGSQPIAKVTNDIIKVIKKYYG